MHTGTRNQIRGHKGKGAARRAESRTARRQARVALRLDREPVRTRRSLDRILA